MNTKKEWFETWFNSPYYHVLYDHRDEEEANNFILKLKDYLGLNGSEYILDLACGAGRHAAFFSDFTKEAIGVDLATNSIQQAIKTYKKPNVEFYTHDMRLPFRINYFNYIFNFFTSFGYFKRESDNLKMLQSIHKGLKANGTVVIDFMNAKQVIKNLVPTEEIIKQGIVFHIRKELLNGKITKHIKFEAGDKVFSFSEHVQALQQDDFHRLLKDANFQIKAEFGNYSLEAYDAETSNRYIVVAQKHRHIY